jgi:hypothetical protein
MKYTVNLSVSGLGIVIYSPFAVQHIREGQDYLQASFLQSGDIARHVNSCTLTAFCTGTPGEFQLIITDEPLDERRVSGAEFVVRLGLEVREQTVVFRDLYDLIRWRHAHDSQQAITVADGFYRLTAYTSFPEDVDAVQMIGLHFERVPARPELHYDGAPQLCPE